MPPRPSSVPYHRIFDSQGRRFYGPALQANNVMRLLEHAWFRAECDHTLRTRLALHCRDCFDLVSKYLLALKARDIGIPEDQLIIDIAQAGGVCRDSDGGVIVNGLFHGIEVKGSCRKGDTRTTFTFKNIRLQGTNWKHLLLVGRVREPTSWLSIEDVESYVWLGHVKRADYIRALTANGRSPLESHDATVTPRCTRGWLGMAVSWTRLEHLTRSWWDRRVLRPHSLV